MQFGKMISFYIYLFVYFPSVFSQESREVRRNLRLNICAIIEDDNTGLIVNYKKLSTAIDVGLTEATQDILPEGVEIKLYFKSAGNLCTTRNNAFYSIMALMDENITCNVFIGPGCDDAVGDVNAVAMQRNIPIIACPAPNIEAVSEISRPNLRNLIRTCFTYSGMGAVFLRFFIVDLNFTNIGIIIDTSDIFYNQIGIQLRDALRLMPHIGLEVQYLRYEDGVGPGNSNPVAQALIEIQKKARFVVIYGHALFVRNIMLTAYELGMTTGEYLFLGTELFSSPIWGKFRFDQGDENDRFAKESYKSLLLCSIYEPEDTTRLNFEEHVRNVSRQKFGGQYSAFESVDPIAVGYYSSVILYANAIREVDSRGGGDILNTSQLLGAMKNVTYPTAAGMNISMDPFGDMKVVYGLKNLNIDTDDFEVAVILQAGVPPQNVQEFRFPCANGYYNCPLPPNRPACGFTGALCKDGYFSTLGGRIIIIVACAAVVICFVGFLVFRCFRIQQDPFWWRMEAGNIVIPTKGKSVISLRRSEKSSLSVRDQEEQKSAFGSFFTVNYKDTLLTVTALPESMFRISKALIQEMNQIHNIRHQNIQRFVGLVLDLVGNVVYRAGELCSRGTLEDVLENESLNLDWSFRFSLMKDIAEGMAYLQSVTIGSHGFLSDNSCLVDSRFVVKVTDFGVTLLRQAALYAPLEGIDDVDVFRLLLWRAPELLRSGIPKFGTQVANLTIFSAHIGIITGDVYSFAILMQQIILRTPPFELPDSYTLGDKFQLSSKDIVIKVMNAEKPLLRPSIPPNICSAELMGFVEKCWAESPADRPTFVKVRDNVRKIAGSSGENIVDHLIEQMEHYAADLESRVTVQTQQFLEEKERTEKLLGQLLPPSVAAALTRGETVAPELYEMVSLYFSDVVGFTSISAAGSAMDVVTLLNNLYTLFDGVIAEHDAYKIETIGDAYMISSGLPVRNGDRHAGAIARTALHIVQQLSTFKIQHIPDKKLQVRIGLHSGSCVAGIVGMKMPRYCLFGDTVKIASRMESSGEPMKIHITARIKAFLEKEQSFVIAERGEICIKDVGNMTTFWLISSS